MIGAPWLSFLFVLANVSIAGAYIYLALTVLRKVKVRLLATKVGGVGFFGLCGLTHLDMAYSTLANPDMSIDEMNTSWYGLAIHVPQAVCVWVFVAGLYLEASDLGFSAPPVRDEG